MKKEAKLLKEKSLSSLTLSIELFNRPSNVGRTDSVLMLLDHTFEMLLKAALLHSGARIREPGEKNTIGFDACVRRALSGLTKPILTDEQALVLQAINGLRDAAQHHLLDISEGHLYLQAQAGVTLYRDLLRDVFGETLSELLPDRVLPVATRVPLDPINLFLEELAEIERLLAPGRRRHAEATAKLRALAIIDGAMRGEKLQPSEQQLGKLTASIAGGSTKLDVLFPGIAAITFTTELDGPTVNLRIVKREGIPVTIVKEGSADSSVVSVRRVNELDFYNLRFKDLHTKLGITTNQLTAMIVLLGVKANPDCAKKIITTWCYSQTALTLLREALVQRPADQWWAEYRARHSVRSSAA
ncbi:hypothetical protein C8K30_105135 [Promicromonospora sp. AC04]|uniref:DUF3644 domain-containing protein n=1 Tax=Promicromonospora sp. AC04 TaxID=2135723 RepID=UPI000D3F2AED|nr:DUF3644 domain-containing protein [Promicromonospora sp. AC04]PUB26908.1 hypothetical protein C8K30_105135 [Promicromonospora sp. AC04]